MSLPRPFLALFAVLLCSVSSAFADQQVAGFSMPDTLAGMEYDKKTDFETQTPGLGVGVRYQTGEMWANVYFFDLQQSSIPDGIRSAATKQVFDMAVGDVKEKYSDTVVVSNHDEVEAQGIPWIGASFTYTSNDSKLSSYLYVTAKDGQFIKIRFNGLQSDAANIKQVARTLLNQVSKRLK